MIDTKEFIDKILDIREQENRNKQAKQQLVIDFLNDCIKCKADFNETSHNNYRYYKTPYIIECSIHKFICYIKFIKMDFNREIAFDITIDNEKILPFIEYIQSFCYRLPDNLFKNIFNNVNEIKQTENNISNDKENTLIRFLVDCIEKKIVFTKELYKKQGRARYVYENENYNTEFIIYDNLDDLSWCSIFNHKTKKYDIDYLFILGHKIFFFIDYLNKTATEESK